MEVNKDFRSIQSLGGTEFHFSFLLNILHHISLSFTVADDIATLKSSPSVITAW